jgi:hypothetical protein
VVTDRMLEMFKSSAPKKKEDAEGSGSDKKNAAKKGKAQ